ncbi:BspA family leucine-rich repeat surface protein, partial [Enterococcus faecalis]|uniref:BspA family leucine-rich repeat surface protein n=1 Tax=Enterococcus faecalis TaxID=1351 RepID=UPI003D129E61
MKVSTYMLVSSLVLGSLVQPVTVLAEEQKKLISSNQSQVDKGVADTLQTQVEKLPLLPEERGIPLSDSTVERKGAATTSTKEDPVEDTSSTETGQTEENTCPSMKESTLTTSVSQTQDSSEVPPEQRDPKESPGDTTLSWGGLTLRLSTDGILSIPGGSTTSDPGRIVSESKVEEIKKIVIENPLTVNGSAAGMFSGLSNLTEIDGLDKLDTSNVTNMTIMFFNCSGLTSLDVSKFDTSNVTDMYGMFYNCSGLTGLDLSKFDTSNVTSMQGMFQNCNELTSLDVSKFDTSNVTDVSRLFHGCSGLTSLDVSKLDTSNVTDMEGMFYNCSGLTSLDVSKFDTSNVTSMHSMFYNCSGLTSLDVSKFGTPNATDMAYMFEDCSGLTSLDVSSFDTSNVTDMSDMFSGCSELTSLRLGQQFKIDQTVNLPSISTTEKYTGKWQNMGTGTKEKPNGTHIWTSEELMTNYSGATDADTYVWQPVVKAADVTVEYVDED